MKKFIPSMLTLANLFLGCVSVVCAFDGRLGWMPYLVFAAGWCDAFDGLAARALGVSSELGKELDSLADMITFGFVPGVVVFHMLLKSFEVNNWAVGENAILYALPAFLITLASAYRLAKFNIDSRQTKGFLGLATPANTMFFLGLIAAYYGNAGFLNDIILNPIFLYAIIPIFSFLLTSEIPMFSAKADSFKWKDNKVTYSFLIFSIVILIVFGTFGLTIGAISYIAVSLIQNMTKTNKPITK